MTDGDDHIGLSWIKSLQKSEMRKAKEENYRSMIKNDEWKKKKKNDYWCSFSV